MVESKSEVSPELLEQESEKLWDLDQLYELANSAFETKDYDQALKLINKGLEQAREQGLKQHEKRFNSLDTKTKEGKLNSRIKSAVDRAEKEIKIFHYDKAIELYKMAKDLLNELYKLGRYQSRIDKRLKGMDKHISDVKELIANDPSRVAAQIEQVSEIKTQEVEAPPEEPEGIGPIEWEESQETAPLVEGEYYDEPEPETSTPLKQLHPPVPTVIESEPEIVEEEVMETLPEPPIEELEDDSMGLEEIIQKLERQQEENDSATEEVEELVELVDHLASKEEIMRPIEPVKTKRKAEPLQVDCKKEAVALSDMKKLKDICTTILKQAGFSVIPENQEHVQSLFREIDILALKVISVNTYTDVMIIVPVKLFDLKGPLIVSEKSAKYKLKEEGFIMNELASEQLVGKFFSRLKMASAIITESLTKGGDVLTMIKKYLQVDLKPEKTTLGKILFLRSGPLQYKVVVDPVLLSINDVGFTEIMLPYAYQRTPNLHALKAKEFDTFLAYLVKKYDVIEKYGKSKAEIDVYTNSYDDYLTHSSLVSLPLFIYGFGMLGMYLLNMATLFNTLTNIGYALFFSIGALLILLRIRYNAVKSKIRAHFNVPYHLQKHDLDDAGIQLAAERLQAKELIKQFMYELFEKKKTINIDKMLGGPVIKKELKKVKKPVERKVEKEFILDQSTEARFKNFLED